MLCTVVGTLLISYWFKSLLRSYLSVTRWWILWVAYLNLTSQGQIQILNVFFINISKNSLAIWTGDLDFFFPICQKPDLNSTPFVTGGFFIIVSDSQLKFWNVVNEVLVRVCIFVYYRYMVLFILRWWCCQIQFVKEFYLVDLKKVKNLHKFSEIMGTQMILHQRMFKLLHNYTYLTYASKVMLKFPS